MKKIKDLTAEDFPGIDADKFESWKQAQSSVGRAIAMSNWFIWPALLVELAIRGVLGATIFLLSLFGWFIYMFTYVRRRGKEARSLGEELGIEGDVLRRALKGEKPSVKEKTVTHS